MAWDDWDEEFVNPASPDYKVIVQEEDVQTSYWQAENGSLYTKLTTTITKTISGLTLEGAEEGADQIRDDLESSTTGYTRQNDANAYMINWSDTTSTAWFSSTTTTSTTTTTTTTT